MKLYLFTSPKFWQFYAALPENIQRLADENYQLLKRDPHHPSLHFKKIGRYWSARVGIHYRAVAVEDGLDIVWFWIGHHTLRLDPGDRPDFVLTLRKVHVGIEVTEVVPTDWARADALRKHKGYEGSMFLQSFQPSEPARPLEQIDVIARGNVAGDGWTGDSVERGWAEAMTHSSLQKAAKYMKPDFGKFDHNWLLIYDNWPLPALEEAKAAKYFQARVATLEQPLPFERIFVECSKTIWQFALDGHSCVPLNDLWHDS